MFKQLRKPKKLKKGFTIVEALISILILAIAMAAGMMLYFTADEHSALGLHKKMATEMASKTMEDLVNRSFNSLNGLNESSSVTFGSIYTANYTATSTPITESGKTYLQIDLTTTWTEAGKTSPRTFNLTTFKAP